MGKNSGKKSVKKSTHGQNGQGKHLQAKKKKERKKGATITTAIQNTHVWRAERNYVQSNPLPTFRPFFSDAVVKASAFRQFGLGPNPGVNARFVMS